MQRPASDGRCGRSTASAYGVDAGEVLGIAGESGSGKTMSMLALLGLLPQVRR